MQGGDGGSSESNAGRLRRLWRGALWWLIRRADGENAHFGRGIPNRRQTIGVSALALTAWASSLFSKGYSYIMGESADACACECCHLNGNNYNSLLGLGMMCSSGTVFACPVRKRQPRLIIMVKLQ